MRLLRVPGGILDAMRPSVLGTVLLPAATLLAMPGVAAAETRGYVFSMIHVATWGEAKAGDGSICPKGGNGGTPEIKVRTLMSKGYSKEEARKLVATSGG